MWIDGIKKRNPPCENNIKNIKCENNIKRLISQGGLTPHPLMSTPTRCALLPYYPHQEWWSSDIPLEGTYNATMPKQSYRL